MKKYISIDIGGTAIKYGIICENAEKMCIRDRCKSRKRYLSYVDDYSVGISIHCNSIVLEMDFKWSVWIYSQYAGSAWNMQRITTIP